MQSKDFTGKESEPRSVPSGKREENDMKTISFVIPCYASEGSIALVMDEIRTTMAQRPDYDYEIVAVNDCSPDGVMTVLRAEAAKDQKVKVVDLSKNGGRHCALMAGFHVAPAGQRFGRFAGEDVYTTKESDRLTRLPLYYGLTEADCETVIYAIKGFYGEGV